MNYPPPYQDLATLAAHICAGESTIERLVKLGLFPQPKRLGGKRVWRWKEVETHLLKQSEGVGLEDPAERIRHATQQANG